MQVIFREKGLIYLLHAITSVVQDGKTEILAYLSSRRLPI